MVTNVNLSVCRINCLDARTELGYDELRPHKPPMMLVRNWLLFVLMQLLCGRIKSCNVFFYRFSTAIWHGQPLFFSSFLFVFLRLFLNNDCHYGELSCSPFVSVKEDCL